MTKEYQSYPEGKRSSAALVVFFLLVVAGAVAIGVTVAQRRSATREKEQAFQELTQAVAEVRADLVVTPADISCALTGKNPPAWCAAIEDAFQKSMARASRNLQEKMDRWNSVAAGEIKEGKFVRGVTTTAKLAEATLALVQQKYDQALALLNAPQVEGAGENQDVARDLRIFVLCRLQKWAEALEEAEPSGTGSSDVDISMRLAATLCLFRTGRIAEAIEQLDSLLASQPISGSSDKDRLASLNRARLLRCRAYGRQVLREYEESLADHDEAHTIYQNLLDAGNLNERRDEFADACNERGHAFRRLERHEEATQSYTQAIDLYRALIQDENRADLRFDLAQCLENRASRLVRTGERELAHLDLDDAIKILANLVEAEGLVHHVPDLGRLLTVRGSMRRMEADLPSAEQDLSRAADLLSWGASAEDSPEMSEALVNALNYRAIVLRDMRRYDEALTVVDKAAELLDRLINEREMRGLSGRPPMLANLRRSIIDLREQARRASQQEQPKEEGKEGAKEEEPTENSKTP